MSVSTILNLKPVKAFEKYLGDMPFNISCGAKDMKNVETNKLKNIETKWIETASNLMEIKDKLKYLKEKEKLAAAKLKSISGKNGRELNWFIFKPMVRKGPVQYNKIPFLKTVDLDEFRGSDVEIWKLKFSEQFDI